MSNKNNVKVAEAGIIGAVIGAAVGAGAVALSNPKNRKFIKNKFNELKDKVEDLTSQGQDKVEEVKKELKAKL